MLLILLLILFIKNAITKDGVDSKEEKS